MASLINSVQKNCLLGLDLLCTLRTRIVLCYNQKQMPTYSQRITKRIQINANKNKKYIHTR